MHCILSLPQDRLGEAPAEQAGSLQGLLQGVPGGPYLHQQTAGSGELVIAVVQQGDGPHQGGRLSLQLLLHGDGQAQIILPAVVGHAHDQAHLGGRGILRRHQLILGAVGILHRVPVQVQHIDDGGVLGQITLDRRQAVFIGVVVGLAVVESPVIRTAAASIAVMIFSTFLFFMFVPFLHLSEFTNDYNLFLSIRLYERLIF